MSRWLEYAITNRKIKQNAVWLLVKTESAHNARLDYFSMLEPVNSLFSWAASVKWQINVSIVHLTFIWKMAYVCLESKCAVPMPTMVPVEIANKVSSCIVEPACKKRLLAAISNNLTDVLSAIHPSLTMVESVRWLAALALQTMAAQHA